MSTKHMRYGAQGTDDPGTTVEVYGEVHDVESPAFTMNAYRADGGELVLLIERHDDTRLRVSVDERDLLPGNLAQLIVDAREAYSRWVSAAEGMWSDEEYEASSDAHAALLALVDALDPEGADS
jgi:hypothetical protein